MLIVQMADDCKRWIAGCMTGTSLDGLDVALVEVRGRGLEMHATLRGMVSCSLGDLGPVLRRLASGEPVAAIEFVRAARRLGELHAQGVVDLCAEHLNGHDLNLVVAHGQTILHAPPCDAASRSNQGVSWQLFDPWPIVHRLRVPVCYDLRQADLIAGGQGAPISPLADWVLYRDATRTRVIVNLGGICNLTILPAGGSPNAIDGYDAGPCNLLIDGVVRLLFPGQTFDSDGALAAAGQAGDCFRQALRAHPWWRQHSAQTGRRPSTGREDFNESWVRSIIDKKCNAAPREDIVASAVDAVADLIADEVRAGGAQQVILAGGGSHNRTLVAAISRRVGDRARVMLSDELGIPVAAREAMAFAVLGALSQDGAPITLPRVTGARQPGRAGAWVYP
jgi:1,6-anhydro-N-acetylmuramate kinase